jgi:hypothetical protein
MYQPITVTKHKIYEDVENVSQMPKSLESKWYALRGNLGKPHCKMNGLVLVWSQKTSVSD